MMFIRIALRQNREEEKEIIFYDIGHKWESNDKSISIELKEVKQTKKVNWNEEKEVD